MPFIASYMHCKEKPALHISPASSLVSSCLQSSNLRTSCHHSSFHSGYDTLSPYTYNSKPFRLRMWKEQSSSVICMCLLEESMVPDNLRYLKASLLMDNRNCQDQTIMHGIQRISIMCIIPCTLHDPTEELTVHEY